MKLGTSTNLLYIRPDGTRMPLTESLELVSKAGFQVFDLNFYDWSLPGSAFLTEGWEKWIDEVAEKAAEIGVEFGQCHAYFYNFLNPNLNDDARRLHKSLQERSLKCCQKLGAHTCVLHPETDYTKVDIVKQSLQKNVEYFKPVLEDMERYGMRLAIENMCDFGIAPKRKYCAYPEELLELVKSFHSKNIGICWDFEHAEIMEQNQKEALLYLSDYLFATHVSDTYSKTDDTLMHVLPLTGKINWTVIMATLKEINYTGDFCYEVHNYMNRLPDEVIPTALRLAYEIGEYLLALA